MKRQKPKWVEPRLVVILLNRYEDYNRHPAYDYFAIDDVVDDRRQMMNLFVDVLNLDVIFFGIATITATLKTLSNSSWFLL